VIPVSFGPQGKKAMSLPPWRTRGKGEHRGTSTDSFEGFTFVRFNGKTFLLDTRAKTRKKQGESPIVGMVVTKRFQPARLEFEASAGSIMPRHQERINADAVKAIDEAIKARVMARQVAVSGAAASFGNAMRLLTGAGTKSLRVKVNASQARAISREVSRRVLMDRLAAGEGKV
jgi:hypothetical protein